MPEVLPSRGTFSLWIGLQLMIFPMVASGSVGGAIQTPSGLSDSSENPISSRGQGLATQASNPCIGTMQTQPNRTTLLSIQGARGSEKTAGLLLGIRPDGSVVGVHNGSANDRWWVYDVDQLANGNLLLSTTEPGISVIEEIDPTTGEHVSVRRFPEVLDSHDADLINGDELLVNDMSQNGEDRVFVYNLTTESITWEYVFAHHPDQFPRDGGGEYGGDWTHNNDVEQISNGTFMVSVRNYDQVVAINRSTKDLEWQLGSDDTYTILNEQHNPDYITGRNGQPSVIVADSLNDRVVEYARENGSWNQTWVLRGGGLNEPRDADRLPNGNTLVVDRRGHRLLEVTPSGEVVWEFYAPWQPYDAERLGTGDESSPPTAKQLNTTGVYEMTGSSGVDEEQTEQCYEYLTSLGDNARLIMQSDATPTVTRASNGTNSETPSGNESMLGTPTPSFGMNRPALLASGTIIAALVVGLLGFLFNRYRSS